MKNNFTFMLMWLLKLIFFNSKQLTSKRYSLVFYGLFIFSGGLNAQTTLTAGDILFTSYSGLASSGTADTFSFVILTPISSGTVIYFTERGYQGGPWQASGSTEGTISWTSGSALAIGQEVQIAGYGSNAATVNGIPNGSVALVSGGNAISGLSLSNAGDQVIAFQGGAGDPTSGGAVMISGINWALSCGTTTVDGWNGSGCTYGPQTSMMPPGLTGGVNAFLAGIAGTSPNNDHGKFNCTGVPYSSVSTLKAAIMNLGNWVLSNTGVSVYTLPSGCSFYSSCTAPTVTANPSNRSICNGANTTFSISATGATAYQWQINTGSGFTDIANGGVYSNATTSTLTITGATAGMNGYLYRCVAKDGSCNTTSSAATLTVSNPSVTASSQTNIACNGGATGAASVNPATGGVGPYTYNWTPGNPTGDGTTSVTGLTAGTWTCTVTDANACTASQTFTVTQPSALNATAVSQTNVSCFGGSNGAASVSASGGAGGYTYNWTPGNPTGDGTASVTGLTAGTWTCTVTDANSCTATRTFTVTQPSVISLTASSQTNIACNSGATGAASVNAATGGAGGYTYNWTPGNPTGDGTTSVTGLTAGTWTCTVTDANSCTTSVNFTVTQPTAISLTAASQTNIACNGGATGAAAVNAATGGAGGYTYDWTPGNPTGDGTASVTGLTAGTWTCTVTDANGCTATRNFTITQPTAISTVTGLQTNVSCNGGTNGLASVSPSGGAGGYTYSWSPSGGTAATATGLAAGSYTVTVTDANGCTATRNYTITQPTAISTVTGSQTNVSCNGGSNGSASVTPSGGAGGYTYSWSPSGGTAATATGLAAGSYTVTVTDANGCSATRNYSIIQPTAISTATGSQTNVSCNGGSNGSASVTPSGGAGGYTYSWSPSGGTAATATGLAAGSYTVTVTDANGCTATRNFTITQPTAISTVTGSQTNVSCNGGTNGLASVSPSGGAGGYTYSWSPSGGTGATATGLAAGSYTVTVTDANGCTATRNYTITQPTAISTVTGSQTNVSCNGGSNGSASVSPSGGAGGYTYSWSPSGGTAATATGLAAGSYTVTVTDANGCTATRNYTITQPTAISTVTGSQTNVSCNGGSNGSASVTPSGGAGGYTYSWSPSGGTAATATGLAAGSYTVTVTDANGCSATRNYSITQPTAISTATGSQTNVSCNGGSNGSASVTPSGGAGGYTYSWSPSGGTAATATSLAAGSYTVTVTDANGCSATRNYSIIQPTAISTATGSQTNVSCNGGSNGSASVTPSGGAGGYTYSWSPSGGTAATATGLAAGSYTVTVTDANGCTATRNFTITQPTAISTVTGSQTNVSCNGGTNGLASVSPSGGAGGYTYSWSPSGGTAATATGLAAGSYTVTVTDANGCTATRNYTITQPSAISTATGSQTNVSCNGGSDGSASVSPFGGTPGYTYSWSPSGGTAATATGLVAGSYTVTVTDANGCTATRNYIITQPTAISTVTGFQTNVSCNGGSNGSASVTPSGGAGGYTYSWSPSGGTATTATGLSAGIYTVTVTDANGCTATKTFTITQPTALVATATAQTNVSCNGGSNGTATVSPTGGTPSYTYSWVPSGGTSATATGLSAGSYTVTVTDANGCTAIKTFTITQPTAISFTTTSLPGYDYNTSYSQNVVATGGTGSITYAVTSGSLPTGLTLSSAGVISGTSTQVADSNFTVTATDANSCTATYNYTLKLNQIPITVTADASQTKVYGSSDPILTYTVTPALLSGDSFTGSLSRAAGENVGSYVINQGTLSAGNKYLITYVSKNFAITAKPITVTANVSQTKVYGTTDPTFTYSVSPSLVSGDSFTGSLTRAAGENIGTYAINQGSLSAGSNYTISYVSKDFAITAKPITVTANVSQTKVYGTANPLYTYTVSPSLISGDAFTGLLSRVAGENVGTYAIQQGSLSAGSNYTISYVSKDFTITAKPITVTANVSQTKVYGTANPVYTYTVSPSLISGDSFTGALSRVTGENVGTYAIQQGSLSAGSNYTISYVSKDFAITAKPITVTVNASQTKVYGTSDPVFTYTVSPSLITGDSFTGALSRATGEDVGTYAIAQGSLTAGTNYLISYVGANFSITKANQTISWNQILELGCDSGSSKNLTATASSGLPVSYVSSNANIATISNGVLAVHDYGFTTLTASQAGNNNYFPATVVVLTVTNSQPNLIRKQFEDIIFFDNSSKQFVSYTWYKDGVLVSGQTSQFYKENGALNGIYYAKATRLDGMVVTSCPLILSPTIEDEYIKIAPNPVKSNASYELLTNVSSSKLQNAHVEVYSVGGMLMQNVVTSQNTVKLTAPVVEGLYIVKMTLSNGKIFTKNLLVKN